MRISADELAARRASLAGRLEEHGLARSALFDTNYVHYYTGFFVIPTEIRPGMVFTVEPGLYAPTLGGFRHSDTVAVNAEGVEWLTYYPRDLESLTRSA